MITDAQMPNMDGIALVEAARRIRPTLAVAASSGRLDATDADAFRKFGVGVFLDKPYREAGLRAVLAQLLQA